MKLNWNLITTPEEVAAMAAIAENAPLIALDTEFIRENTFYPIVELIQIATADEAWLIDAQAFRGEKAKGIEPLLGLLRNPKILKILHAAQGDQECFYTSYGAVAVPSFDTAVGASLCGFGDGVGLGNLLKSLLGVTLRKGHARTNWAARPLPKQLLEYALADVEHLVEAAVTLLDKLDKLGRKEWALQLSAKWEDARLYESHPADLADRLAKGGRLDPKAYAALIELMKWRETRVRELNLPRRWVADDQVLLDLAQVRPKDLEHLGAFRGLNKGEIKTSGGKILEALRVASERVKEVQVPRSPRSDAPSAQESQVMDLLKTYLGILADREKLAVRHLLTVPQLLALIRCDAKSAADLAESGLLSGEAARLVGDEILAVLHGKRALSIDDGRIKIVSIDHSAMGEQT